MHCDCHADPTDTCVSGCKKPLSSSSSHWNMLRIVTCIWSSSHETDSHGNFQVGLFDRDSGTCYSMIELLNWYHDAMHALMLSLDYNKLLSGPPSAKDATTTCSNTSTWQRIATGQLVHCSYGLSLDRYPKVNPPPPPPNLARGHLPVVLNFKAHSMRSAIQGTEQLGVLTTTISPDPKVQTSQKVTTVPENLIRC